MAATEKQSNRRGTAKTTSDVKIREKQTRKQVKSRELPAVPDRDHFADNSGGFDHIDHR